MRVAQIPEKFPNAEPAFGGISEMIENSNIKIKTIVTLESGSA